MELNRINDAVPVMLHVENKKFDDKNTMEANRDYIGRLVEQEVQDRMQARTYRKALIIYTYCFSAVYLIFLIVLSALQGFQSYAFNLDSKIFIALVLLGGIHLLGLIGIVLRYLFSTNKGLFTNTPKLNK